MTTRDLDRVRRQFDIAIVGILVRRMTARLRGEITHRQAVEMPLSEAEETELRAIFEAYPREKMR